MIILILGIFAAGFLYWQADRAEARRSSAARNEIVDGDVSLSADDSKKYGRSVAINSGEMGVLTDKFQRFSAQWLQGKPLAFGILALSLVAGLACFKISDRLAVTADHESTDPSSRPG